MHQSGVLCSSARIYTWVVNVAGFTVHLPQDRLETWVIRSLKIYLFHPFDTPVESQR